MYLILQNVKSNKNPAQNAYFLICILQIFNIGTIGVLINYFIKFDIDKTITVYSSLALALVVMFINYFLLYSKREGIFQEYKTLLPERKTKGKVYFWLYVVLSFVIFFVSVANLVTPKY